MKRAYNPSVTWRRFRSILLSVAVVVLVASVARAQEIRVLTSGGFAAALHDLVPALEAKTQRKIMTLEGSTLANGPDSIPGRLQRGDAVDVVIMSASGLDDLIRAGKIFAGTRADLARSGIGMAVRAGAPKPDISSLAALKQTLLRAKSIAYSSSISGVYLTTELFPRLGIAEQVAGKSIKVDARERVGAVVARGEAEIGFQQTSELVSIPGIVYVGALPPEAQRVTVFAAGIAVSSANLDVARTVIAFLASESARQAISKSGLDPAVSR